MPLGRRRHSIAATLILTNFVLIAQQTPDQQEIGKVIRASNVAEMGLYGNPVPRDDERRKPFNETVTQGGPRDLDVNGRVDRAHKAGRKALDVSHKIDEMVFTEIKADTAIVDTRETGYFRWSDDASPPFNQVGRRHTYYMKKVAGKWLIDDEVIHPPDQ
jgi:hypothetical protein